MAARLTVTPRVRELPRPADGIGGPDGDAGRAGEPGVPPGPVMLTIEVPGRHNALNAAAAFATAVELGVPGRSAAPGLPPYPAPPPPTDPKGQQQGVRAPHP